MKTLVIVDVQNDFMEGGALAVNGGKAVAEKLCKLFEGKEYLPYDKVVFTQDYHPKNHCSFKANGGPWPVHCVQDSDGAEIDFKLLSSVSRFRKGDYNDTRIGIFQKGKNPDKEEYGADLMLENSSDNVIEVVGIALDYCVKETAKMIKKNAPEAKVIIQTDYCAAISGLDEDARKELDTLGIEVM